MMASIPFTSYSATKVHSHVKQQQQQHKEKPDNEFTSSPFQNPQFGMDPVLSNYNSKLMNSIWGRYNLYASHAFQKNNEGALAGAGVGVPQVKALSLWDYLRSFN